MQDPLLEKLANASELANLPADRIRQYEKDMITELDRQLQLEFAENKSREQGREEILDKWHKQTIESVRTMRGKGLDVSTIAECLGISQEEVNSILAGI